MFSIKIHNIRSETGAVKGDRFMGLFLHKEEAEKYLISMGSLKIIFNDITIDTVEIPEDWNGDNDSNWRYDTLL